MSLSIGEMLDNPTTYWDSVNDIAARITAIQAVSELRLLDHVGTGPTTAAEIAERSGYDSEIVRRLIEFLAAEGVLDVNAEGFFLSNKRSQLLQTTPSVSWAYGTVVGAGQRLAETVKRNEKGLTAWEVQYGKPIFQKLAENPEWGRMFGECMGFSTAATEPKIFELHTFKPFNLAVDVGGSFGNLMMRLLSQHPQARGIIFDLPETIEKATVPVATSSIAERVELVAGSFFESVPSGGDLYLLKHILHDWNDDECIAILRTVRAAMASRARLAIIERLIPDQYIPHSAYSFDIVMLLCTSGRERRLANFQDMLEASGFAFDRVTMNPNGPSVIEAVAS